MTDKHLTDTRFDSFDLPESVLQGIREAGFEYCTPIQAETLPIALTGEDLAGQAQTGTGKTAAFLIATLNYLLQHPADERRRPNQPRTLILAPTRELAVQIYNDAQALTKHTEFTTAAVYGGTGYDQQRKQLETGVDILIGTPGRLIDYLKQRVYDLNAIQVLVLDEADRMFDLGFIKDIRFMMRRCPPPTQRLGMLFSATLSYRVKELAYEHMNNPHSIEVAPEQVTAEQITETCYMTANEEKIPLLIGLINGLTDARSIVFINTKRVADKVWGFLQGNGIDAAVLSGDVPQKKRLSLLKRFQEGELSVLVATDVAARGLHIPDVTHVINYDLPEDAEDYVHRIGRTARAGASGDAISFACETYAFSLPDIEVYVGHPIPTQTVDPALLAEVDPKSRVYPEKGSRQPHRGKDGRKAHGRGHHHKAHKSRDGEHAKKRHRRHGPKPPQSSGTE
ncbi:MAG: ATP-dependent RNA helicase RhlB [Candidatus Thiodiazotropha sp. (ex Myrtea spinifera)]|nr:ATP-dependent RNA helicase RhlB [Candidatus Thiodiazotropha sp. (ex Myrtea spinifera)]